ncbi:ABC transporter substrate-binding protein [Candidatus Sumerlaeota bacterium]|nr:ABC transporter substrate-binding protein [Candidatus Sumerlaeota bacterium]
MKRKVFALIGAMAVMASLLFPGATFADDARDKEVIVGYADRVDWMPFKLMEEEGFLADRCKEFGVKVKLKEFKDYKEAVNAYTAGQLEGVTVTSFDVLQPAAVGTKTVAVLPNAASNGADGILVRKGTKIADLKGKKVAVQKNSVSHYLLEKALVANGLTEADVTIVDMGGDEAGKNFLLDESLAGAVTWEPHLGNATTAGKGDVAFSSRDIPGEIVDLTVFRAETVRDNSNAVRALVLAWFDAMNYLDGKDTRDKAIQAMSDAAAVTPEDYKRALVGVKFYRDADKASKFFDSPELKDAMDNLKKFAGEKDLLADKSFSIGWAKNSDAPLQLTGQFLDTAQGEKRANKIEREGNKIGNKFNRMFGREEK